MPKAPPGGLADPFLPEAAAFKAAPTSHASCFNCHWKSQQPTRENCGGCHTLPSKPILEVFGVLDLSSEPADYVPIYLPELRISLKFRHSREQHVKECTACHINITRSASLRGLQPDVPISSCSECHQKDGLRQDVGKELAAIDKNRDFICSYCHTSDVGHRDPPASHYLIAGRDADEAQGRKVNLRLTKIFRRFGLWATTLRQCGSRLCAVSVFSVSLW